MSFQQDFDVSQDPQFQQRLSIALVRVAANVTSEDPQAANHANRTSLAKLVASNVAHYAQIFAVVIMANASLHASVAAESVNVPKGSSIPDDTLEFVVGERWDIVAGKA
jgi:hypothetical protein